MRHNSWSLLDGMDGGLLKEATDWLLISRSRIAGSLLDGVDACLLKLVTDWLLISRGTTAGPNWMAWMAVC